MNPPKAEGAPIPRVEPGAAGESAAVESGEPSGDGAVFEIPVETEEGAGEAAASAPVAAAVTAKTPLISVDEARNKIGSEVLSVLDEKFKGSLTEVRHPDERDHFF